jgi:hypothetical protein
MGTLLRPALPMQPDSPSAKRQSRHVAKLNMGESLDDIHVCIMCLRAIMNNKVSTELSDTILILRLILVSQTK